MKPIIVTATARMCALSVVTVGLLLPVSPRAQAPGRGTGQAGQTETIEARAARVHREAIVLDTHIDTTSYLTRDGWDFMVRHPAGRVSGSPPASGPGDGNHVDYPRMRQGGFDAAFFSIFMPGTVTGPEAVRRSLVLIDAVRRLADQHPNEIALATSAADVRAAHQAGRIAALMGMEGGHMIDDNLSILRSYQRLGIRYLTLSHSVNTNWSDSSGDTPRHNGLTAFGKDVVRELNRLGIMVDVSHVADKTFWDAVEVSRAPIVASHSSARALSGHPRNMTDEMIKALADRGGVIQINYLDQYLDDTLYKATVARQAEVGRLRADLERQLPGSSNAEKREQALRAAQAKLPSLPAASWERIIDHIDHVVKIAGATHVGLGSDFDGATMPVGMEDCSQLPNITLALLRKGYSDADVTNILGGNLLRLMERVEAVGRDMRGERAANR